MTNDTDYFNLILEVATHDTLHTKWRGDYLMDLVVAELKITGVFPKDVVEKVINCIKSNVELISPNAEKYVVEGLDVEIKIID